MAQHGGMPAELIHETFGHLVRLFSKLHNSFEVACPLKLECIDIAQPTEYLGAAIQVLHPGRINPMVLVRHFRDSSNLPF